MNVKYIKKIITNVKRKKQIMDKVFLSIITSESFIQIVDKYISIPDNQLPEFIFAGIGKNWYICQKVVKTFLSMGLSAQALDCGHALHGDLGMLDNNKKKVIFFISRSGTTVELINVAKIVKQLSRQKVFDNIFSVGFFLNSDIDNDIRSLYDFLIVPDDKDILKQICEFDDRNLVPSLSIDITQLVLDLLGVIIYEHHKSLIDNYVYHHLSGNNGKRLGGDKILKNII